jgi:choline dehydrogenase
VKHFYIVIAHAFLLGLSPSASLAHNHKDVVSSKKIKWDATFDYIVVGMGASGATLAKLLSDDHSVSVAGLEAGNNHDSNPLIFKSKNALHLHGFFDPEFFWQGVSAPSQGEERDFVNGRLLGGGTSINGEQYVRGTINRYRKWFKLVGGVWSPKNIFQAFKQLETYNGRTTKPDQRGFKGPYPVRQAPAHPATSHDLARDFVNAVVSLGFKNLDKATKGDYNITGGEIGAFSQWQLQQFPNGTRGSTSRVFLNEDVITPDGRGVNGRKLHVFLKTTALRVIWKLKPGCKPVALGVSALQEGNEIFIRAKKKVILSAGIHCANILLQSGVGPASYLKSKGIKPVFNNPHVGRHFINQTLYFATFIPPANKHGFKDPNALYSGGAFLPDPRDPTSKARAFELIGLETAAADPASLQSKIADLRIPLGAKFPEVRLDQPTARLFNIIFIPVNPKSRGNIQTQSNDPLQIELVHYNYFRNPDDIAIAVASLRVYLKGINNFLSPLGYKLIAPDPSILDNDAALRDYILSTFDQNHHYASDLRMAPRSQGGVVSNTLHVFGVKKLMVIDANIFPFESDGNTTAPAVMVAWLAFHKGLIQKNK